jgi:hypothetical protein
VAGHRLAVAVALLAGVALALLDAPRPHADSSAAGPRPGPAPVLARSDAARGREAGPRPSGDPRVLALARRFLRGLLLLEGGHALARARALLAATATPRLLAHLGRGPPQAVPGVHAGAVRLVALAAYGDVVEAALRWKGETDAVALTVGRAGAAGDLRVLAFEP